MRGAPKTEVLERRGVVGTAIIVSALVAVAAFGGVASAEQVDAPTLKPVKVRAAGIVLGVPSTWIIMPTNRREAAALRRRLAKTDKNFASFVVDNAALDKQPDNLAFRAIDLRGAYEKGVAHGNVRIYLHDDRKFPSSTEEARAHFEAPAALLGATVDRVEQVQVGDVGGFRVDMLMPERQDGGRTIPAHRIARVIAPRGTGDVSVDVTTANSDSELADVILRSVRRT